MLNIFSIDNIFLLQGFTYVKENFQFIFVIYNFQY